MPIAEKPIVKINSSLKTVGIRGLETGFDWYWNKGDKSISQDTGAAKLAAGTKVMIQFKGLYPIIVVAEDPVSVADRVTNEGGTGLYESIEDKTSIDTKIAATDYANALLRRYAKIGTALSFDTYVADYQAGQLVNVNIPEHGINEDMLVNRVNISDPGTTGRWLKL